MWFKIKQLTSFPTEKKTLTGWRVGGNRLVSSKVSSLVWLILQLFHIVLLPSLTSEHLHLFYVPGNRNSPTMKVKEPFCQIRGFKAAEESSVWLMFPPNLSSHSWRGAAAGGRGAAAGGRRGREPEEKEDKKEEEEGEASICQKVRKYTFPQLNTLGPKGRKVCLIFH